MVRDLLSNRIKDVKCLEFIYVMEKYYIYNSNVYQIIRASKHYKLDGGWYVDVLIRNANTGKKNSYSMRLKEFKERTYYTKKPRVEK